MNILPDADTKRRRLDAIERVLRRDAAVFDCAVLQRAGTIVAYVVHEGAKRDGALADRVQSSGLPSIVIVPVTRIPRSPDGTVDEAALVALPVLDSAIASAWEQAVARVPGVREAAALLTPSALPGRPVHVADLWPEWRRGGRALDDAASAPVERAAAAGESSLELAEAHGPALAFDPDAPQTLGAALVRAAAGLNGVTYVREDGSERVQPYAALLGEATHVLTGLREAGCVPGDVIIFQLAAASDFLPVFWACMLGGFVPVPVAVAPSYTQPNATVAKLRHAWTLLGARLVVTTPELLSAVTAAGADLPDWRVIDAERLHAGAPTPCDAWHQAAPDDLALLLLTSGSTGLPKAVRQSHAAILTRSRATCEFDGFTAADVSLNWFPLEHVGGLVMFHVRDVYATCAQVQVPTPYVLASPLRWLDLIERYRATITWAPNFAFGLINAEADAIAARHWDLSSLRFILNGGEAIVARTARRFLEVLEPHRLPATAMRPAWGMSETCSGVTSSHAFTRATTRDEEASVVVGPPLPGVSLRIVDAADRLVPVGMIGRLQIRGRMVTTGYHANPEANSESFTADGWFTTGDLARLNDGCLTITGRQKDVIIINGNNFYCQEIEAEVEQIPGVAVSFTAACAVRMGGTDTDELAIVFHPIDGWPLARLLTEIRRRVIASVGINPTYLVPVPADAIPKTEIGKIQRTQVRQQLERGDFESILREVDVLLESRDTVPDWCLEPVWQRRNATAADSAPSSTIYFTDDSAIARAAVDALRGRGQRVVEVSAGARFARLTADRYELSPDASDDYGRLLTATGAERIRAGAIVLGWECGPHAGSLPDERELEESRRLGALALANVTKAFGRAAAEGDIRLLAVTAYAQAVTEDDVLAPSRMPIVSLLQAVAAEQAGFRCSAVDVTGERPEAAARAVACELASVPDGEVAYRQGVRHVRRLRHVSLLDRAVVEPAFERGALYAITGGSGGVATAVAGHLLKTYGAHVLLLTRRPFEGRGAEAFSDLERLALEHDGSIAAQAVDLSDAASIRRALADAERASGRAVKGVLHLAGAYHDRAVADETADTLNEVWAPKMAATIAMLRAIDDRDAWFVGFSSALTYFGGAMVGAYAAANRFLESAALASRREGRRRSVVAWSGWDQLGMSREHAGGAALRARGFRSMPAVQAIHTLVAAADRGHAHLFAGLDSRNRFIARHLTDGSVHAEQVTAFAVAPSTDDVASPLASHRVSDEFGTAVPCEIVRVAAIPRLADGQIDVAQLLGSRADHDRVAPATERERQVAEIWQEVLGCPAPAANDNFFELGGHSLLAMQTLARFKTRWGLDLPLRVLFEAPTVRALAERLDTAARESTDGAVALDAVSRPDPLPLSFTQQRLWFIDQLEPASVAYNIPCAFRLIGPLDTDAITRSLTAVVARHEALRTTFPAGNGQPAQRIDEASVIPVPVTDLSTIAQGDREGVARDQMDAEARRPFDLANGPMVRARVLRMAAADHWLIVTLHHISADGWSLGRLAHEIAVAYDAAVRGEPLQLPPLDVQYADYAVWQRATMQGDRLSAELAHWTGQLAGVPTTLALPTDRPRPAVRTSRGGKFEFVLDPALVAASNRFLQTSDATLFMTWLAAFQAFLFACSGQADFAVGSPIIGRPRPQLEPLIGFFANTLLLRCRLASGLSYHDLVTQARSVAIDAYAHQELPFEKLVEALRPPRDRGRNPLFQVNFRVAMPPPVLACAGLSPAPLRLVDTGTSKFDIALELSAAEDGISYFEYSADLFDRETVHRLKSDFEALLGSLLESPRTPLRDLPAFAACLRRADGPRFARGKAVARQLPGGLTV